MLASVSAASIGGSLVAGRAAAGPGAASAFGQAADGSPVEDDAWVETPVDTTDSGEPDRVYVRVTRPASTTDGERLPVIATASPYYGDVTHSDATPEMLHGRAVDLVPSAGDGDASTEPRDEAQPSVGEPAGEPTALAGGTSPGHRAAGPPLLVDGQPLVQRYVPEGYVIARVSSLGTHRSTGCYTAAGPPTIEALAAVVDWFNGRATAYDSETGGDAVTADWTDGTVGFMGASAHGELANGLATTGVDGLAAIVPQAANNGQYSLFRSNGTPVSIVPERTERMADLDSWIQASNARRSDCGHWAEEARAGQDRATGNYNDFWHDREFLPEADAVEAAVLLTHAVDDETVTPNNAADWYEVLSRADVPLKLWLHEGGHTSPRGRAWRELLDRWWAYWLKGVDNGVMDEDPVTVVHGGPSADRGTANTYETWPVPGTRATTVRFGAGGATAGTVTVDGTDAGDNAGANTESLVDDPTTTARELVAASDSTHRLRYQTPPLGEAVHVSGRVVAHLAVSFDEPTVVSVALVEYGTGNPEIVTRGWADPLNRPAYSEYDSPVGYKESLRESRPIDADEQVTVEFPLQATDHVFDAGTRLGLVVYASDRRFTLHPPGNATTTVALAESTVGLPVVGGQDALASAIAAEPPTGTDDGRETTDTNGATGPGFGLGTALGALGGGYLLGRRRGDEPDGE